MSSERRLLANQEPSQRSHCVTPGPACPPACHAPYFLTHLTGIVTVCRSLESVDLLQIAKEEATVLGVAFPGGPRVAADRISEALHRQGKPAPIEPDIIGEAVLLRSFGGENRNEGAPALVRAARRANHRHAANICSALARTCQDFASDECQDPLDWVEAFIRTGESDDFGLLIELEQQMSTTSGYIDLCVARPLKDAPVGLMLRVDEAESTERSVQATIDYGVHLANGQKINYEYDWWAVNAFAMNEREFLLKYDPNLPRVEFTYYHVEYPIDELLIVLKLPVDFPPLPNLDVFAGKPSQITHLSGWQHDARIETSLRQAKALRYVASLKIAALRVHQPEQGCYYGIQWRLPSSPPRASGPKSGRIRDLLPKLVALRGHQGPKRDSILLLLRSVAEQLRAELLPDWGRRLEVSLAVLDEQRRKMIVVAAAGVGVEPDSLEPLDYSAIEFDYGEGLVGKVFKTNEYRLYVRVPPEERETPDFYRARSGSPRHEVLLTMPVQNPDESQQLYAVLNFGSDSAGCPLRDLERPNRDQQYKLRNLQAAINLSCFEFLTGAWRGD